MPGDVEREIAGYAREFGRMPTANELVAAGRNDLAVKTQKQPGGYRGVASRLGLPLKMTETHRGQAIEAMIAEEIERCGFSVHRQTTKAPFDLLIDGVRVDVKSGAETMAKGRRVHVFALNKVPPTCDMYILVGVDGENRILWRYYVPAEFAHVRTISVTAHGKYTRFREDIGQLRALVEAKRVV